MTVPYADFQTRIVDLVERSSFTATLGSVQNQRLVFGGIRGSGGGEGGPIQPFVGKLRQTDVAFDTDEFAVCTIPSGENASLLDNLNRIRAGCTIMPTGVNATCYIVTSSGNLIDHLQGINDALCGISVSGGHIIQDEGIDMTPRANLNFVGAGVTVTDDAANNATVVTIPSVSGVGGYPYDVDTVDGVDPDADFDNITSALSEGSKDWVEAGPQTFQEDITLENRNLKGVGQPIISGAVTVNGIAQITENVRVLQGGFDSAITIASGAVVDLKHIEASSRGYAVDVEAGGEVYIFGGEYTKAGSVEIEELTPPTKDNILANGGGVSTYNFGARNIINVGNISTYVYREIIKFDLSGVTGEITSARLKLYVTAGNGSFTLSVYRILSGNANWPEGTATGSQQAGSSCWDYHTYNTDTWAGSAGLGTADTDYDSTALGSKTADWGATSGWIEIELTATEIEKLRNGTYTHCGFLLKSSAEGSANFYMEAQSKEAASNKPILELGTVPGGASVNVDGNAKLYGPVLVGAAPRVSGAGASGFYLDSDGNQIGLNTFSAADAQAMKVLNDSGATAEVGDVGYIENGEYKTTTTAYKKAAWCVVVVGGADNSYIYVARRGRVLVNLNANCSVDDYLYTSTTAGQAQPSSYMRPEMFAVALTANASGAGGTCEALLYCNTKFVSATSSINVHAVVNHGDTDFRTTIGGVAGAVVTYNTPLTSGNENTINVAGGNELAKLRLYNETRGDYALIDSVNTGANQITLTAAAPAGWAAADVITTRSQTTVPGAPPPYFYELDLSSTENTVVPALARSLTIDIVSKDSGGASEILYLHPYKTYAGSEVVVLWTQVANVYVSRYVTVPLFQQRFCYLAGASGAATKFTQFKLSGWTEAAP